MAERRAGRRQTRQQFEVQALTSRFEGAQQQARASFQAEQQGILQGFQQQMEQYGQQMESYEAQAQRFQEATKAYNEAVNRFNTVNTLPGTFTATPVSGRPGTFLTADSFGSAASNFLAGTSTFQALSGVPGANVMTQYASGLPSVRGFDAAQLPSDLVLSQVGSSRAGYPQFQVAQRAGPDPGAFTAELGPAPEAPDTPSIEGLSQQYTESLERERQFFEREIGARRSASMRARRRIGARPLLSGE
jgi:hypothetical protein